MAKHHPDLIFCRKQAGVAIGRLCEKCDGKCVICDSYVRPCTLVRICDECNYGSYQVWRWSCAGKSLSRLLNSSETVRRAGVSSVAGRASLTPTTARSAQSRRRIGTVVPKL